jgi:hypothetical protein
MELHPSGSGKAKAYQLPGLAAIISTQPKLVKIT